MAIHKSIYNKQNMQCHKNCDYFCFYLGIVFSRCSFPLQKRISSIIRNESCKKGLKYCKFTRKIIKLKHVMKKDHSKS